uniref:Sodefrin-like factor n=1 Tax=Aneides ferreus TaxID=154578 RepID=Q4FAD0_9SALA|nr:sodefrin precursor-like factor [Aneides ferreus]
MNAFLTGVIFLMAFTATGNCIDCIDCYSPDGTDCSGEAISCAEGVTTCQTVTVLLKEDGVDIHQVFKECGTEEEPNSIYREASLTTSYQMETQNCKTDKCNEEPAQFTPSDNTPNGVKCLNCLEDHSMECNTEEIIECTGDMNKCLFIAGLVCHNDTAYNSCAHRLCTNVASAEQHPFFHDKNIQKFEITDGINLE